MSDSRPETGEHGFERLVTRLDEIASALESGELDLDEALRLYEEGAAILRQARDRLEAAEGRVRQIRESEDGELYTEPFPGERP